MTNQQWYGGPPPGGPPPGGPPPGGSLPGGTPPGPYPHPPQQGTGQNVPYVPQQVLPGPRQAPPGPRQPPSGLAPWAEEAEAEERRRRRKRLGPRARRGVEAAALLVLLPLGLGIHWYDDAHTLLPHLNPGEKVTVVPHGGTGTVEHVSYRMVGRESGGEASTDASGGVEMTLDIDRRPLDQQGLKAAKAQSFRVRDREGHIWVAVLWESSPSDPAVGTTQRLQIQATVPKGAVSVVVLDVLGDNFQAKSTGKPLPVLRMAH